MLKSQPLRKKSQTKSNVRSRVLNDHTDSKFEHFPTEVKRSKQPTRHNRATHLPRPSMRRYKKHATFVQQNSTLIKYLRKSIKIASHQEIDHLRQQIQKLLNLIEPASTIQQAYSILYDNDLRQVIQVGQSISLLLYNMLWAQTLLQLVEANKAIKYFRNAISISKNLNYDRYCMELCFRVAECCKQLHKMDQSAQYLELALGLAIRLKDKYEEMKAFDFLGMCYYYKGNTDVAYFYHSRLDTLDDRGNRQLLVSRLQQLDSTEDRKPSRFGLKLALEQQQREDKENEAVNNKDLIKYPAFHSTLNKIRDFMERRNQVGHIKKFSKQGQISRPISRGRSRILNVDSIGLTNQVMITHQSPRRYHHSPKQQVDVSVLGRGYRRLLCHIQFIYKLLNQT